MPYNSLLLGEPESDISAEHAVQLVMARSIRRAVHVQSIFYYYFCICASLMCSLNILIGMIDHNIHLSLKHVRTIWMYLCRLHVPIGYHGRASSVVVSGTSIRRPRYLRGCYLRLLSQLILQVTALRVTAFCNIDGEHGLGFLALQRSNFSTRRTKGS